MRERCGASARRLFINPTLAGYPRRHRGGVLAGDQQRPAARGLAAAGIGRVYSRRPCGKAKLLLRSESHWRLTPLSLTDFHRQPVYGLYCRGHRQLMRIEKALREGGITVYEADVRPPERFLMERFITAPVWADGESQGTALVNARLKPNPHYRPPLKWVSLDIETSRHGELYCIGLEGCGQRTVYMLGPENGNPQEVDFDLEYVASRPQLLEKLNAPVCSTRSGCDHRLEPRCSSICGSCKIALNVIAFR